MQHWNNLHAVDTRSDEDYTATVMFTQQSRVKHFLDVARWLQGFSPGFRLRICNSYTLSHRYWVKFNSYTL